MSRGVAAAMVDGLDAFEAGLRPGERKLGESRNCALPSEGLNGAAVTERDRVRAFARLEAVLLELDKI